MWLDVSFFIQLHQSLLSPFIIPRPTPPPGCVCPSISPTASLHNFLADPWPPSVLWLAGAGAAPSSPSLCIGADTHLSVSCYSALKRKTHRINIKKKTNIEKKNKSTSCDFSCFPPYLRRRQFVWRRSNKLVIVQSGHNQVGVINHLCDDMQQCFEMCPLHHIAEAPLAFLSPPPRWRGLEQREGIEPQRTSVASQSRTTLSTFLKTRNVSRGAEKC